MAVTRTRLGHSRSVYARYYLTTAQNMVSGTVVNYDTKDTDTHNAVTTGAGWTFTAPEDGLYTISVRHRTNTATAGTVGDIIGLSYAINGEPARELSVIQIGSTTTQIKVGGGTASRRMKKGDTLQVSGNNNTGQTHAFNTSNGPQVNFVEIARTGNY